MCVFVCAPQKFDINSMPGPVIPSVWISFLRRPLIDDDLVHDHHSNKNREEKNAKGFIFSFPYEVQDVVRETERGVCERPERDSGTKRS